MVVNIRVAGRDSSAEQANDPLVRAESLRCVDVPASILYLSRLAVGTCKNQVIGSPD